MLGSSDRVTAVVAHVSRPHVCQCCPGIDCLSDLTVEYHAGCPGSIGDNALEKGGRDVMIKPRLKHII